MILGSFGLSRTQVQYHNVHSHPWSGRITLNTTESTEGVPAKVAKHQHPFTVKWEKRKKTGYAPSLRSGCTMALWSAKNMGVLFGGVTDEDTNEETLESVFHNDMCVYSPHSANKSNAEKTFVC